MNPIKFLNKLHKERTLDKTILIKKIMLHIGLEFSTSQYRQQWLSFAKSKTKHKCMNLVSINFSNKYVVSKIVKHKTYQTLS